MIDCFVAVTRQMDTALYHRQNTTLNVAKGTNMRLNDRADEQGTPPGRSIDLVPYPAISTCTYRARQPWPFFSTLFLRYMTQIPMEPVS